MTPHAVMRELFEFIGVDPACEIDASRVYNRSGKTEIKTGGELAD